MKQRTKDIVALAVVMCVIFVSMFVARVHQVKKQNEATHVKIHIQR